MCNTYPPQLYTSGSARQVLRRKPFGRDETDRCYMDAQEDRKLNIDLTDYWMIIRKRFVSIFLVFLLVLLATMVHIRNTPPKFQATAKIKLALRQPMATINGAQITWYGSKGNEIPSEIKLIKNKTAILAGVVDALQHASESKALTKNPDFFAFSSQDEAKKAMQDYKQRLEKLASFQSNPKIWRYIKDLTPNAIRSMLDIAQVAQTNIIEVKVTGPEPELCKAIANTLAIVYNIDYWKSKTLQAKEKLDFISHQLANAKAALHKEHVDVVKTAEEATFLGSAEVYKTELTSLRIELQKLQERYTPKHPKIIKLKHLIANIEKELSKIPKVKQDSESKQVAQDTREESIKLLENIKLTANIDYQAKLTKAQEEIQVISWAKNPIQTEPNTQMLLVVGTVFGLLAGCIFAFVWEGLDTSIGKIEDVERITGLPVIAHIPLIGAKERQLPIIRPIRTVFQTLRKLFPFRRHTPPLDLDKKVLFNFGSMSVTAEAYRTLRTNIQFAIGTKNQSGNIIAITSTSPREGKTLTSTNLAIALAQMGKTTLLLEADMRCPQIAPLFKMEQKPGLSDILIGTAKPDTAIRTLADILISDPEWEKYIELPGVDNLHILPCGTTPPNPTELLISTEFHTLMDKLRPRYDFIIVDTPPTLPVSDACIVGTLVDGTVIIYQSDTTSRHLLLRVIQTLKKSQAKLIGIVINQLSFDVVLQAKSQYYGSSSSSS